MNTMSGLVIDLRTLETQIEITTFPLFRQGIPLLPWLASEVDL
jgi:hypothetical protein